MLAFRDSKLRHSERLAVSEQQLHDRAARRAVAHIVSSTSQSNSPVTTVVEPRSWLRVGTAWNGHGGHSSARGSVRRQKAFWSQIPHFMAALRRETSAVSIAGMSQAACVTVWIRARTTMAAAANTWISLLLSARARSTRERAQL